VAWGAAWGKASNGAETETVGNAGWLAKRDSSMPLQLDFVIFDPTASDSKRQRLGATRC